MGSVPTGWEIEVESLSRGRWASKNPREWETERLIVMLPLGGYPVGFPSGATW